MAKLTKRAPEGEQRGFSTDTLGLILAVVVQVPGWPTASRLPGRSSALWMKVPRLKRVYADRGYRGTPAGLVWRCFGWLWHLVEREEDQHGFVDLKKRWISRDWSAPVFCARGYVSASVGDMSPKYGHSAELKKALPLRPRLVCR